MSAFKKLRSTDSFISVYNAYKNRTFNSSSFGEYGITVKTAVRDTGSLLPADSDYNEALNYRSINHLYYNDFNDESGVLISGSLEQYLDSSLFSGSRILPESASIISLPKDIVGTHIKPGSFSFSIDLAIPVYKFENLGTGNTAVDACANYPNQSTVTAYGTKRIFKQNTILYNDPDTSDPANEYVGGSDFFSDGKTAVEIDNDGGTLFPSNCSPSTATESNGIPYYSGSTYILTDNGEGALSGSGTIPPYLTSSIDTGSFAGDIIYRHGLISITDSGLVGVIAQAGDFKYTASFESTQPVFTSNNYCKTLSSDFLFSTNPSACQSEAVLSGSISYSGGLPANNVTGSEFSPYITTVGLYNDAHELVAVAKLGQPIPKSKTNDMTFVVKFDI
jgi:hypothetical protein